MLEGRWTVGIGAVQGLLLWAAHEAALGQHWPVTPAPVLLAWYAAVIGAPLAAQLLAQEGTGRRRIRLISVLGLVLAGLGAYVGYAAGDSGSAGGTWVLFGFTVAIAWFVTLPFASIWLRRGRFDFPYEELFSIAWSNSLTLALALLFTGTFWALLGLWGGLFALIGIDFFADVFVRREFAWPASTIAFSVALALGRSHAGAVATVRKVVLSVFRGLLPLISLMALLFLLSLPVTGLQALWDTGHAAALMLVTQLAMILFVNAAWQDGQMEPPFHPWVRRLVTLAVVALPIYSLLTLHALMLRVMQHGWTGDRVWGTLVAGITTLYAFGYMAAALRRGARWLPWVASVNVGMALIVIAVLVAANSPLLDPMRVGAESQMNRLLERRVAVDSFDFRYLRFDAGRYGIQALDHIAGQSGDPEAEAMGAAAKQALAQQSRWEVERIDTAQVLNHVTLFPAGRVIAPEFARFFAGQTDPGATHCAAPEEDCVLLAVDLDRDGKEEYVALFWPYAVFTPGPDGWRKVGRIEPPGGWVPAELRAALERRDYGVSVPHWGSLRLGDRQLQVIEEGAARE